MYTCDVVKKGELLVAIMNDKRDFAIACHKGKIDVESAAIRQNQHLITLANFPFSIMGHG